MNAGELRQAVANLLVVRASGHATDRQRRYPRWELSNNELEQPVSYTHLTLPTNREV